MGTKLCFTRKPRSSENMPNQRFLIYQGCAAAVLLFFPLILLPSVQAEPRLPHLFSDHMVLQRDMDTSVWGWADPGERISVSLGAIAGEAVATAEGSWKVVLPARHAGGPFTLAVRGKKTLLVKDVLLGEVWVASGQSNMAFALRDATGSEQEIPNANNPALRFFTVPQQIATKRQIDTLDAAWKLCTPETAKSFSAVAYYFARDLQRHLHVTVGIILSAWSGSAGEEWTDHESLRRGPEFLPIIERWNASPQSVKSFATHAMDFNLEFDDFELVPAENASTPPREISNFDSGTATTATGGFWTYSWKEGRDTVFELTSPGRGGSGYAVHVGGRLDGASSSRLEAVFLQPPSEVDLSAYAGIRFWLRGNGSVQTQLLQPTITDFDNYAAPTIRATPEWKEVTVLFRDLKQAGWGVSAPLTLNAVTGFVLVNMTPVYDPARPPSGLYNGMISPLQRYRIRGAIWYQGEGNTMRAHQYRKLLPALIAGWRKGWGEGNFPFLIVQLPNHGTGPELGDSIWAELREAQLATVKSVPNTGLAVTIDVGDAKNVHPPRKKEVGQRLALWAVGTTYGYKIVYSGPLYDSMRIVGNEIRISFRSVGAGLEARGDVLKGFAVAGADTRFYWAQARIEGAEVVVSSTDVSAPVAVRYAWAGSPDCNLYNKDGLPASPFRTDDWPGASAGKQ